MMLVELNTTLQISINEKQHYKYDKGNYEMINKERSEFDSKTEFQNMSVNGMWETFKSKIQLVVNRNIPQVKISRPPRNGRRQLYMNGEL